MRSFRVTASVLALAIASFSAPAFAYDSPQQSDLISFGAGYFDYDKTEKHTNSADFRLEYRSHYAWQVSESVGFHPWLGGEMTSRNLEAGFGGFLMDWNFCEHGIFTWQEGAGYVDSGDQKSLGGTFQFRSQAEVGYRFDNDMRVTAQFSHISDAKLTRVNPGAEILGMYVHVPIAVIAGTVMPSK